MRVLFSKFQMGLLTDFLFLGVSVGGNVDTIGIQLCRLQVLRLQTGLVEQALEFLGGSEEL